MATFTQLKGTITIICHVDIFCLMYTHVGRSLLQLVGCIFAQIFNEEIFCPSLLFLNIHKHINRLFILVYYCIPRTIILDYDLWWQASFGSKKVFIQEFTSLHSREL